ncbi:MAG: 4Fe-4S dicluster domain-containing protein [Spirochaetales bacterium]|nr:4Fe-4S dicluster domain-containing protein [Spirochaetales bacterium]
MEEIIIEKLDHNFKYLLAQRPGAENIKKCYACGTCTSACPVFQVENEYSPRRIIRMILMGMKEEVLKSKLIWLCARCYTCSFNCPQGVDFSNIMAVLRELSVEAGYVGPETPEKIDLITTLIHEARKDCINLILDGKKEQNGSISRKIEDGLSRIMEGGGNGS